jgi:DNA-3-methyladenine glycosylase
MKKLSREFYDRDTVQVAKSLLGQYLVHRSQGIERVGKIVEVEAYLGEQDLAAHSSKGRTKRTEIMFGPPGFAYVYLIYGIYHCFNVVTESLGSGTAVLLRAIEPVANISGRTQGPGLLCQAMGLNRQHNAHDLLSDDLFITKGDDITPQSIIEAPRIGVHYAKDWALKPLRFYIAGNAFVSKLLAVK